MHELALNLPKLHLILDNSFVVLQPQNMRPRFSVNFTRYFNARELRYIDIERFDDDSRNSRASIFHPQFAVTFDRPDGILSQTCIHSCIAFQHVFNFQNIFYKYPEISMQCCQIYRHYASLTAILEGNPRTWDNGTPIFKPGKQRGRMTNSDTLQFNARPGTHNVIARMFNNFRCSCNIKSIVTTYAMTFT